MFDVLVVGLNVSLCARLPVIPVFHLVMGRTNMRTTARVIKAGPCTRV